MKDDRDLLLIQHLDDERAEQRDRRSYMLSPEELQARVRNHRAGLHKDYVNPHCALCIENHTKGL